MKIKKLLSVILSALMLVSVAALAGCGSSKEKVIIYTAAED